MTHTYRVELELDDNGTFLVTCPALPGVVTFGESEEDCAAHARDAIEEAIAARINGGQDVPLDDVVGQVAGESADIDVDIEGRLLSVTLPALTSMKVDLYRALRASGVTRAELARRLHWNRNSVDRLFILDHASRLDQLEAAAGALGLRINAEMVAREFA